MTTLNSFYNVFQGFAWDGVKVSSNFTAVSGKGYVIDTSGGAITMTLPASPDYGDTVSYKDIIGTFADFNLTISGNGENIQNLSEDLIVDSNNAYGALTYTGPTYGWVLTSSSPSVTIQSKPLLHVQDQKTTGTGGGTSSTGFNDRVLNTVVANEIQGASLSANEVTLPAGKYYIEASAPSAQGDITSLRIRDTSDTNLLIGSSYGISTGDATSSNSEVSGSIELTSSTSIKVSQYIGTGSVSTTGLGYATSQTPYEVYTDLRIWKLDSEKEYPRVYQPVNQPVVGAYTTGGIFGGELVYNTTTTVDVSAYSCMSDDLTTELAKASTTTVDLGTPSINTIYHIFAVKYSGGTFGAEADTDINGAGLPGTVIYKRWLGFVRTNSSGNICSFAMNGDVISWLVPSEVIVVSGLGNISSVLIDLSSLVPVERVEQVMYAGQSTVDAKWVIIFGADQSAYYNLPTSSASTEWNSSSSAGYMPWVPKDRAKYVRYGSSSGTGTLLLSAVKLMR